MFDFDFRKTITEMLGKILQNQERIMTAITDLQAADQTLQSTVATVLADYATALTNAAGDPAAIESVVTDMNNMVTQLNTADPAQAPVTPPAVPPTA
jgi:hypothetical protein